MFKKLRNRLLIVNMFIIAALVIGSFSVIYITMSQNVTFGIERDLNSALKFAVPRPTAKPKPNQPDGFLRPEKEDKEKPPADDKNNYPRATTFTVTTDKNGTVQKTSMFDLPVEEFYIEDFYSDKMPEIVRHADKKTRRINIDGEYWAYQTMPIENGFVTAFTEYRTQHMFLVALFLILLIVGLFALGAAFLISLFFANRSIRPVEESYNKQKQFVADASHELKTPLTTINTNVDVLLSHTDSTIGEEKKWLDYIKNEAERMTKLTNDLLYLAKIDHGNENIILSRVSFSEASESVILLMEATVFESGVRLSYDIEPDLYVKSSSAKLRQLVMILLDNALKYTPKSGDINIRLSRDGADAVFVIRNSGAGISESAQKHIFERFYREDESRARESGGYGLGLAIAKAIVTSSKGSIAVRSRKNEYAEFTVKIPISK